MSFGLLPGDVEKAPMPIAIFVHVHYPDAWNAMADWIERTVQRPFHLVLTTSDAAGRFRVPGGPFLASQRTIVTCNRGRDIRPFLQSLRLPLDYEIGLKLHTKRATHRLEGEDWGRALIQSLLPNPEAIDRLVDRMSKDRRLALVAPDGMLVSLDRWMGANRKPMLRAAKRLGLGGPAAWQQTPVFCAGSMFWFRREALALLERHDLDDLFEAEIGQVDGTTAHALERLFASIAESTGGVITTMEGAVLWDKRMTSAQLRAQSRMLADRPNPYLRRPPRHVRWALTLPGLRSLYAILPIHWRHWIRNRLST